MLSHHDKQEALQIARATLEAFLLDHRMPPLTPKSKKLEQKQGAFVTLHAGTQLRGCIGTFNESEPLYQTIQNMAVAAAIHDPRFPPIDSRELPATTIEISVLSTRRPIAHVKEITVGRHGLAVSQGPLRGVLLPQVAADEGWNREEFLTHTCLKAGLTADAWEQGGLTIEVFEAEVFGESKSS